MHKLTVVTITNGDLEPLARTANSFQPRADVEWIVVSARTSMPEQLRQPDIFIGEQSTGVFQALNIGLASAHGEFIIFMNSGDEFYSENVIEEILASTKTKDWDWAQGRALIGNRSGQEWRYPSINSMQFYFGTNSFCHQSMVTRTELLRQHDGFQLDTYASDWLLMLELSKITNPHLLPFIISVYEHGGLSTKQKYVNEVLQKHRGRMMRSINRYPRIVDFTLQIAVTALSKAKMKIISR